MSQSCVAAGDVAVAPEIRIKLLETRSLGGSLDASVLLDLFLRALRPEQKNLMSARRVRRHKLFSLLFLCVSRGIWCKYVTL